MIRMREIKFRAWHKVREIMRNVTQITYFDDEIYTVILGDDSFACPPKDVEIMQYTGLKDKNGKDIYEGDIVSGDGMYNDVIVFKNGTFTPSCEVKEMRMAKKSRKEYAYCGKYHEPCFKAVQYCPKGKYVVSELEG